MPEETNLIDNHIEKSRIMETKLEEYLKGNVIRGLSGLVNLGNTCYMNSILQCLSSLKELTSWLLNCDVNENDDENTNSWYKNLKYNKGIQLIQKLKKDMKVNDEMEWNYDISDEMIQKACNESVVMNLRILIERMWEKNRNVTPRTFKTVMGNASSIFKGSDQNDSQEFLYTVLDIIHDETKNEVKLDFNYTSDKVRELLQKYKKCQYILKNNQISNEQKQIVVNEFIEFKKANQDSFVMIMAMNYWKMFVCDSHSIITDLFYGMFYSTVECLKCRNITHKFDAFNILALEMKNTDTTLEDSLAEFTKEEKLVGDEQYFCEYCNSKVDASKKICIFEVPNILIVQFKRFNNNNTKNHSKVTFPIDRLDISKYTTNVHKVKNTVYNLNAVSRHVGSCGGGHYTAYVKHNNKWYDFDDQDIWHVPLDKLNDELITKDAYILFYTRI